MKWGGGEGWGGVARVGPSGARLVEALNQSERQPYSVADQVATIYAGTGGYLDRIKTERVPQFLGDLLSRLHAEQAELVGAINEDGLLDDQREEQLGKAIAEMIDDFGPDFDAEGNPLEEGESDRIKSQEERDAAPKVDSEAAEEVAV